MKKFFGNVFVDILLIVLVVGGIGFYLFDKNEKKAKLDESPITVNAPTAPAASADPAPAPAATPVAKEAPKPQHKEAARPAKKQHKEVVHQTPVAKPVAHKEAQKPAVKASDDDLATMRDMLKGN